MKKVKTLFVMTALFASMGCMAQNIQLPAPQHTGGMNVTEALWNRASGNEYSDQMLSEQDLSDLLFAAIGVNRDNGKLTSPTAGNSQEIRLFVFTKEGVSEYMNQENSLRPVVSGDHRRLIAAHQDWVMDAPVSLLMVIDCTKFKRSDEHGKMIMSVDVGIVCENINLFCAGKGWVTRPRGSMDVIMELLGLDDTQIPLMNNPVGYAK